MTQKAGTDSKYASVLEFRQPAPSINDLRQSEKQLLSLFAEFEKAKAERWHNCFRFFTFLKNGKQIGLVAPHAQVFWS
jgi:hypothetical protein